jgi:peptidoglycan/LPS O-acetylase OafA/YrhL
VQHLLLLQIYDPAPWWHGTGAPGIGQMWSLATEVAFYLVLPLIAAALAAFACRGVADAGKRARRLVTGLTVLGMCSFGFILFEYLPDPKYWLEETLPQSLVWFACGMVLSVVSVWAQVEVNPDGPVNRFCRTVAASGGTCWLIAALVFAIACTPVAGPAGFAATTVWDTEIKTALYAIVGLVLVAPAALQPARETRMSRALGNRVMRFLGKISYGVYLWQFLVIFGFFNLLHLKDGFHHDYPTIEVAGLLIAIGVITVVVSTASYFVIEGPAQRLYGLVPQSSPRHAAKHRRPSRPRSLPPP